MKSFLLLLLKIAGILLILNFIILFLVRTFGTSRFEDYYRSVERISAYNYDLLITGDSHANACWRPNDISGVADLSFPGDNYEDIVNKLQYLNNEQIKYDVHLMEVDPQVFSTYRESTNNNDLSSGLRYGKAGIWIQVNFPLFFNPRIETEIMTIFKGNKDLIPMEESPWRIDSSSLASRANTQFIGHEYSRRMVDRFNESTELTLRGGARPVLIHYPLYPSYMELVSSSIVYKQAIAMVDSTRSEKGFQFLDYSHALCDSRFFKNQDHVNQSGAEMLLNLIQSCFIGGNMCNCICINEVDQYKEFTSITRMNQNSKSLTKKE